VLGVIALCLITVGLYFTKKLFQSTPSSTIFTDFNVLPGGVDAPSGISISISIIDDDRDFTYPRPHYDGAIRMTEEWGKFDPKWYHIVGEAQRREELYQALKAALESFRRTEKRQTSSKLPMESSEE
jgi:hypothetical protein